MEYEPVEERNNGLYISGHPSPIKWSSCPTAKPENTCDLFKVVNFSGGEAMLIHDL